MTTAHYLVTVHLNIDLPLALLQPEPADAPTGPEPEAHAARAAATAAGAGSASMKKSKPEPISVMDYRQYRRARRLVHECCNYDGATASRWTMGRNVSVCSPFPTPCCAGGSGRRCCRWTRELETALFHCLDAKTVRRLRGAVHTRLQPGQILPGMWPDA